LEIIPFIDIMFFLLVTFLMVSIKSIPSHGIAVRLPGTATSDPRPHREQIDLAITGNNSLFWNQEEIPYEQLSARLKAAQATSDRVQVVIHGDEKANFKEIIQVLDAVRGVGITAVTLATSQLLPSHKP
jgi:biopolymer transport protein ExbD